EEEKSRRRRRDKKALGDRPPSSPAPVTLVPGKQPIGKPIIEEPRERQRHAIAEQRRKPPLPRRYLPQRNRDIRADDEPPGLIGPMQASPDVIELSAI